MYWQEFLTIMVFVFSLVMAMAGVFTAYFGNGKSRKIGLALLVIGIILCVVWAYLVGAFGEPAIGLFADVDAWDVMRAAIFNIAAAAIGALVAIGIFLVAVMKS